MTDIKTEFLKDLKARADSMEALSNKIMMHGIFMEYSDDQKTKLILEHGLDLADFSITKLVDSLIQMHKHASIIATMVNGYAEAEKLLP